MTFRLLPKRYKDKKHFLLTWFWIANFPICALLYFFASTKVMGLYIALCSVYANVESSAGADEAKKAQNNNGN